MEVLPPSTDSMFQDHFKFTFISAITKGILHYFYIFCEEIYWYFDEGHLDYENLFS